MTNLTIAVPDALYESVRAAIDHGAYGSPQEVVLDALGLWSHRDSLEGFDTSRLGELWDEGMANGDETYSLDEVMGDLLHRYKTPSVAG